MPADLLDFIVRPKQDLRSRGSGVRAECHPQQEPSVAIQRQARHLGEGDGNLRPGRFMYTPLPSQRASLPQQDSFRMSQLHWSVLTPGPGPWESQGKELKHLPFSEARKNRDCHLQLMATTSQVLDKHDLFGGAWEHPYAYPLKKPIHMFWFIKLHVYLSSRQKGTSVSRRLHLISMVNTKLCQLPSQVTKMESLQAWLQEKPHRTAPSKFKMGHQVSLTCVLCPALYLSSTLLLLILHCVWASL